MVNGVLASGYTAEWQGAGDFKHRMVSAQRWAYGLAPSIVRATWRAGLTPITTWFTPELMAWVRTP